MTLGHTFVDFKSAERICWACGYVVPRLSDDEVVAWMIAEEGREMICGNAWHVSSRDGDR